MAIDYGGKTYDNDWFEIDAMGRRLTGQKDWAANASYAADTGTQNPYTNQAGSSEYDASGLIPGNEPGSTLPAGAAPGGWLDDARIKAFTSRMVAPSRTNNMWSMPKAANAWALPQASGGTGGSGGSGGSPSSASASSASSGYAPVLGQGPYHMYDSAPPTNPAVYTDMAQAQQGLADVYRQALGRDPGAGDVDRWLSGEYGYGSGLQDYDQFVAAIMGSPEARAYRPAGTPAPGAYQGIEWWQQNGVPAIDMFDPITGQLRPGWEHTANGYGRSGGTAATGTPGANTPGPPNGDFQSWFAQLTNGKPPTPETLESLAPILAQYGIRIGSKGNRGWSDTIILPDGRMFDVIEAAGIGSGKRWQWNQNGGAGYTAPQTAVPSNQYNDPYTQMLEQMLSGRIGALQQPVNDPNRAQYDQALQQRAASLAQMTPELNRQIAYLEQRFNELQGTGYTGAENETIRTGALDPIEQDRKAARDRVLQRLSARGLDLNSGIAQAALLEVDKAFDSMRGTTQTALTMNDLNRRDSRQSRAETIRGTLSQIPEGRAREQLDIYSALNQLSALARQEDEARQREAMGYGGMLADLGPQRLQLALQASGAGGNPSSMFSNLMQLAGMNQNAAMYGMQNQNSLWSGLGSIAYSLMNAGR